jgi:hypothetical protein
MSHSAADFAFAHRLPTDVAQLIPRPGLSPVGAHPARRRLVVLVLAVMALAGGIAATRPSGHAEAMVEQECVFDLDQGSNSTNDPVLCL